jgi:hypothetical protein
LNITDRTLAILEQVLNTTLIEPEAQENERLQDLSKEELIEQLIKAKVSHPARQIGSVITNAARHLRRRPQMLLFPEHLVVTP